MSVRRARQPGAAANSHRHSNQVSREQLQRENERLLRELEDLRRKIAKRDQQIADAEKQIADLELQHSGPQGGPIQISNDDLDKRITDELARIAASRAAAGVPGSADAGTEETITVPVEGLEGKT